MRTALVAMVFGLTTVVASALPAGTGAIFPASPAQAQDSAEGWKQEFDDICSKNENAMAFTVDELKQLVGRCESLQPRIEALAETPKKVYLKRLKSCKDLYIFLIKVKEQKQ